MTVKQYKYKPENDFYKSFVEWNRSQKTPYTSAELARKMNMSRSLMSQKLTGEIIITVEEAIKLCNVTGAPLTKIIKQAKENNVDNYWTVEG